MKGKKIIEGRFKTIKKLSYKILEEFNADDIHDFRVEVKKLRAFLRLLDTEKKMDRPLIPKLLKTFYGYVGIIRNIQLLQHNLLKYITEYKTKKPEEYLKILDSDKDCRQKNVEELMANKNFDKVKESVIKDIPDKLKNSSIKKFAENKLDELKRQLQDLKDDVAIHNVRKILKDILYTRNYIKDKIDLPAAISKKEDLKLLTAQLGDFRDKCIEIEFLQPEYLDKIKNAHEKVLLLKIKNELQHEKQIIRQQLQYSFNELLEQL